ncbi:hypothetical protein [Variovorax sp. PvP013]|uniref:hypothetical protein n=1 Tax=Variovorax sp. PvP013 TaxID=3156435 RepID=UPI003D2244E5
MAGSVHACSRAFAIDLDFAAGSADLEKTEIVRLTAWLDKWRTVFTRFERVMVDGIALEGTQDAKALSRRRAEVTTRAVRQLLESVPIYESSHLNSPFPAFKGGNYAGIDLVPFQEDLPECGKPIK